MTVAVYSISAGGLLRDESKYSFIFVLIEDY